MSNKFKPKDVVGLPSHPHNRMTVVQPSEINSNVRVAYFDESGRLVSGEISGEALMSAKELDQVLDELDELDRLQIERLRSEMEDEDE